MTRSQALTGTEEITRARAGDPDAFQSLVARYGKPVLSFIYHLLGDCAQAEDLTQETFIRAYQRLATVQDESRLSTWLFGIARNVVREAIRDKTLKRRFAPENQVAAVGPGPEQQLVNGELQRAIRRALETLPEDHRLVFVLKMFHNLRYEEIAQITGSSVGKLKTDLHRARQRMRRTLEGSWGGPQESRGKP